MNLPSVPARRGGSEYLMIGASKMPECFPILWNVDKKYLPQILGYKSVQQTFSRASLMMKWVVEKIYALYNVTKFFFLTYQEIIHTHTYMYQLISTVSNLRAFFPLCGSIHMCSGVIWYLLMNSSQMAICTGAQNPVQYSCKGTWCTGKGWCIEL